MTDLVVEVGPGTITGLGAAPAEWIATAIDCIDDEIALLDETPVAVADLWCDVLDAVADDAEVVVFVVPAWWPSKRIERIRQAAGVAEDAVLERISVLRGEVSAHTSIVEIASDCVVVTHPRTHAVVVPRHDDSAADLVAVKAAIEAPTAVLIDAPEGVADGAYLAASIVDHLRAAGTPVRLAGADMIRRAVETRRRRPEVVAASATRPSDRKRMAVIGGGIVATLVCGGFALWGGERSVGDTSMTWLTEGRVAVSVPSSWNAERITSGPGSARVQVVSPIDQAIALHITQSVGLPHTGLAATAHSLRAAWQEEPEGVFVDFDPSARRAERDAVTYREIRADRHIEWTVLVEDTVRIAIGCQSAPGREHLVRDMCDRAIESAHEIR